MNLLITVNKKKDSPSETVSEHSYIQGPEELNP